MSTREGSTQPENEKGLVLSWALIGVLAAEYASVLMVGVPSKFARGLGTTLIGVNILTWGSLFLASYFYSQKSFVLRGLMWVCENFSSPRNRKMAFFYFVLAAVIGGATILTGLGAF